jgi:formyl-CoA transferase
MSGHQPILDGVKVVELATYIAAPVAGTILADFGAEVIKVEPPGGDPYRYIGENPGMPTCEHDYAWHADNHNKKGIMLDLTVPEGHAALMRLIAGADIFITNQTRPTRRKFKLGYDDLKALNPRLIYASLLAYGEEGPEADKAGFDSTAYWARSGLMHMVKPDPAGTPARSLPGQGDHPTGLALFGAIMLALFERERTGLGRKVHTSLLANGIWSNLFYAQSILCGGDAPLRPRREEMPNALTNHYRCRDDRWFILSAVNQEREWPRLIAAIGDDALAEDPRFVDAAARRRNAKSLGRVLDAAFATRDWPEWRVILDEHRVTFGTVATVEEITNDEQMLASGTLQPADRDQFGADHLVATPLWLDGVEKSPPTPAPAPGQHTEDVFRAAGFSEEEIETLKESGGIPA